MTKWLHSVVAAAVGVTGLLGAATASASNNAVIYVHGTGDYPPAGPGGVSVNYNPPGGGWMYCGNGNGTNWWGGGARCSFDPIYWESDASCGTYSCGLFDWGTCNNTCYVQGGAAANYWTQGSINSMANGEQYLVVSYDGANQSPTQSWGLVVDQIHQYVTQFGITNITIVTHSDGANVIRYAEAHPTQPSPTGSGNTWANVVGTRLEGTVFIAGTMKGTPLADGVSWIENIPLIGDLAGLLIGAAGYSNPAVMYQQQANMQAANYNYTFGSTPDEGVANTSYWLNGAYAWDFAGQGTSYSVFGGQCDSYSEALGLWTVAGLVGWNWYGSNPAGNTDGFVGQDSGTYIGMQWMTSGNQQNHNQSRRSCGGVASEEQYILSGVNNYGW